MESVDDPNQNLNLKKSTTWQIRIKACPEKTRVENQLKITVEFVDQNEKIVDFFEKIQIQNVENVAHGFNYVNPEDTEKIVKISIAVYDEASSKKILARCEKCNTRELKTLRKKTIQSRSAHK